MELKLRELRKAARVTQAELAAMLSVDIGSVGNWERGKTVMSAEQVWNCAKALGCTPNDILGWKEYKAAAMDKNEAALVENYRALTPERKKALLTNAADGAELSRGSAERNQIVGVVA